LLRFDVHCQLNILFANYDLYCQLIDAKYKS